MKKKPKIFYHGSLTYTDPPSFSLLPFTHVSNIHTISISLEHILFYTKTRSIFLIGLNLFTGLYHFSPLKLGLSSNISTISSNITSWLMCVKRESDTEVFINDVLLKSPVKIKQVFSKYNRVFLLTFDDLCYEMKDMRLKAMKFGFKVKSVFIGYDYLLILNEFNELYGLGSNVDGQLGIDCHIKHVKRIVLIKENVKKVFIGHKHNFILTLSNKWFFWGNNFYNQLPNCKSKKIYYPKEFKFDDLDEIFPGKYCSYLLTKKKNVYYCGGKRKRVRVPIRINGNNFKVNKVFVNSQNNDKCCFFMGYVLKKRSSSKRKRVVKYNTISSPVLKRKKTRGIKHNKKVIRKLVKEKLNMKRKYKRMKSIMRKKINRVSRERKELEMKLKYFYEKEDMERFHSLVTFVPVEIFREVFYFLDVKYYCNLASTSEFFHSIINDEYFWKVVLKRDFFQIINLKKIKFGEYKNSYRNESNMNIVKRAYDHYDETTKIQRNGMEKGSFFIQDTVSKKEYYVRQFYNHKFASKRKKKFEHVVRKLKKMSYKDYFLYINEFFLDSLDFYWLVTESFGDSFHSLDSILEKVDKLSEAEIIAICQELLTVLYEQKKDQNFFITSRNIYLLKNGRIKIDICTDLRLTFSNINHYCVNNTVNHYRFYFYASPEFFDNDIDINLLKVKSEKKNIWSLGILMKEMLEGKLEVMENYHWIRWLYLISKLPEPDLEVALQNKRYSYISDDFKDFFKKCVRKDANKRASPSELINHPLYRSNFEKRRTILKNLFERIIEEK